MQSTSRSVAGALPRSVTARIAPERYYRQGDASKLDDNKAIFANIVSKVSDEQVMSELDATVAYARRMGMAHKANSASRDLLGRTHWRGCTRRTKDVDAASRGTGRGGDKNAMNPAHPIDVVGKINAPVLASTAALIRHPNDTVDKMRARHCRRPQEVHDPYYPIRRTPFLRGLPAELPQAAGRGRLEAGDRMAQKERSRMTLPGR